MAHVVRRFDHECLLPTSLGLLGGSLGVLFLADRLAGAAGTAVAVSAAVLGGVGLVMLLAYIGFAIAQARRPEPHRFVLPAIGLIGLVLQIQVTRRLERGLLVNGLDQSARELRREDAQDARDAEDPEPGSHSDAG